jgi:hypothetical protein
MQVVKYAWLDDVQGSEAGQFGVWICVGKIIVLVGRKGWNFEHNFLSIVKMQLTKSVRVFIVFALLIRKEICKVLETSLRIQKSKVYCIFIENNSTAQ